MRHIQTTLEGITVENGYANTLHRVERVLQRGQSLASPMAYLLEGDDDVVTALGGGQAGALTLREIQVGIVPVVQQEDDVDARSASEVMNSLIADVQKAMQVDAQRGGAAVETDEVGISSIQIDEGQPVLSCAVAYRIRYRHRRTDPTQGV